MWWSKKKEVKSSLSSIEEMAIKELYTKNFTEPKYSPQYRVVAKEKSVNVYESETIIYMKKGKVKKYVSITKSELSYHISSEDRDLVTGNRYNSYRGKDQIKATIRTCTYSSSSDDSINRNLYTDGIFTIFQVGDSIVWVKTDDVDRVLKKSQKVVGNTVYEYDELEKINE